MPSRPEKPASAQPDPKQADLFSAVQSAAIPPKDQLKDQLRDQLREQPKRIAPRIPTRPTNGLLRVREAAARLALSKSTLDKMRCDGRGPPFVKVTSKIVAYDPADLDRYAESRKRQGASES
jgi:predicted DNA-binding transcriptional regulator AlpA